MERPFQGIPALPDLTHPHELMEFGTRILELSLNLAIFVAVLGIAIAVFKLAYRRRDETQTVLEEWVEGYFLLLKKLPHFILILAFLAGGFF